YQKGNCDFHESREKQFCQLSQKDTFGEFYSHRRSSCPDKACKVSAPYDGKANNCGQGTNTEGNPALCRGCGGHPFGICRFRWGMSYPYEWRRAEQLSTECGAWEPVPCPVAQSTNGKHDRNFDQYSHHCSQRSAGTWAE